MQQAEFITISAVDMARQPSAKPSEAITVGYERHLCVLFQQGLANILEGTQDPVWWHLRNNVDNRQASWQTAFADYFYSHYLGPFVTRNHPHLTHDTPSILSLWQAVGAAAKWLADKLWQTYPACLKTPSSMEIFPSPSKNTPLIWNPSSKGRNHPAVGLRMDGVAIRFVRDTPWYWLFFFPTPPSEEGQLRLLWACQHQVPDDSLAPQGPLHLVVLGPEPRELTSGERTLAKGSALFDTWRRRFPDTGIAPRTPSCPMDLPSQPREIDPGLSFSDFWPAWKHCVRPRPAVAGPGFVRIPLIPGPDFKAADLRQLQHDLRNRLSRDHFLAAHRENDQWCLDITPPRSHLPSANECLACLSAEQMKTALPVGLDANLGMVLADLASPTQAHLLVAGQPGSGKRAWVRTALAALISANTPDDLRLALIDADPHTFRPFQASPYLLKARTFHTDEPERVDSLMGVLLQEAQKRQRLLSEEGVARRCDYIAQSGAHMPLIVCVCNEMTPLVQGRNKSHRAIAAKVRQLSPDTAALGIIFIWVTDSQERDVLKGPMADQTRSELVFRMNDGLASRLLLGSPKAADLAGRGDLFYQTIGGQMHLQGLQLAPDETRKRLRT